MIRNMFTSAVASSTAVGTFETRIGGLRALHAWTSTWSYPAPVEENPLDGCNDRQGHILDIPQ